MDQQQYDKLPELFRQIITIDDQLADLLRSTVMTIDEARDYQPLIERKRELVAVAERIYGKAASDGGKATA